MKLTLGEGKGEERSTLGFERKKEREKLRGRNKWRERKL